MIPTRRISFRMRNDSEESRSEKQATHFMLHAFPENRAVMR
jgi:hypothetical protein